MTEIVIDTPEAALELLRPIVAGKESFVYKADKRGACSRTLNCQYVEDGQASCLLGQAFHARGVRIDQLKLWDDGASLEVDGEEIWFEGGSIDGVEEGLLPEGLVLTDEARSVLAAAQDAQDGGSTWGDALAAAESCAAELKEGKA